MPVTPLQDGSVLRRRSSGRHRVVLTVPVRLGRFDGTLVDISTGSARVTHPTAIKVGVEMPLSFVAEGQKFSATAKVTSCRVVSVGGGTVFESRLVYAELPEESKALLERLTAQ